MRGAQAEDAALRLLLAHGLKLVCRNYRCRGGELDLVMLDGQTLVVVEVRARSHAGFASALESIDRRKQDRLVHATQMFLAAHPAHAGRAVRFDVLGFGADGRANWVRAAFDAA
ncbi:YraN family protein [Sinimarinibacterium thermocellulolyticum]|uniref:UPF0102 protein ABSH63_03105 n=1 Tax=Sinimarinibacterium thermocellulolyticum TaxID=3170016 RepID=A0ABV2A739_9GAMM